MKEWIFTGVCTALVTPFGRDGVDIPALRRLIRRQLNAGVPALLACGTTGEASTLTEDEWEQTLRCTVSMAHGRAAILAGTGTNDLRRTLERARLARALGADAQLVVTPYYNQTTQAGLIDYFTRVAEGSELPVIVYNVPGRTGLNLLPETAARLAEHPQIMGIKEAAGDLNQLADMVLGCRVPVYCGTDRLNAAALRLGAAGMISVLSNLLPEEEQRVYTDMAEGRAQAAFARQQALQPVIRALFAETSPAPVKAALALLGLCADTVRSPLVPVQPDTLEALRSCLLQEVTG